MFQWRVMCVPCCLNSNAAENYDRSTLAITICAQKLFVHLPLMFAMAIACGFYLGANSTRCQPRSRFQLVLLQVRSTIAFLLSCVPVVFAAILLARYPLAFTVCDMLFAVWILILGSQLFLLNSYRLALLEPVVSTIPSVRLFYRTLVARVLLMLVYALTLLNGGGNRNRATTEPGFGYVPFARHVDSLGVPLETATFRSQLNFSWVQSLICRGNESKLTDVRDLYELSSSCTCEHLVRRLERALIVSEAGQRKKRSLLEALWMAFGCEFCLIGLFKFGAEIAGFFSPLLLKKLIEFVSNDVDLSDMDGYWYACGLLICVTLASYLTAHFDFRVALIGLKIRSALLAAINRQLLTLRSYDFEKSFDSGQLLNFVSTDIDRIVNVCLSFHAFWSGPLQIIVILWLLWQQIGLVYLVSLIASILLVFVNQLIAMKINGLSVDYLRCKDRRVKAITEILGAIKLVKFNVWERHFIRVINDKRNSEMNVLEKRKYLDAICVYFWATSSVTISFLTIITYYWYHGELKASIVFTTIFLLGMLIKPLNSLPWVFFGLVEFLVSVRRVNRLFQMDSIDSRQIYEEPTDIANDLEIDGLRVQRGQLVAIVGGTGCGKTRFLNRIIGEEEEEVVTVEGLRAKVRLRGHDRGFGYVGQDVWLERGSIRDNICFGSEMVSGDDLTRYDDVIRVCSLLEDVKRMPNGDRTEIGENGCFLSGGQRVRVALARACFANKSIYVFDDIFAGLDANVAIDIVRDCLKGFLCGKTIILVTHSLDILKYADRIIELQPNGQLNELANQNDPIEYLTQLKESTAEQNDEPADNETEPQELQRHGTINVAVVKFYVKKIGYGLTIVILCTFAVMQTMRNLCDWCLSKWIDTTGTDQPSARFYIETYIALVAINTVTAAARAFLYAYGNLRAAREIHRQLTKTVMCAKQKFFDTQPHGRILNRFVADTSQIDDSLAGSLNILLAVGGLMVGTVLVSVASLNWLLLIAAVIAPVYYRVQKTYRQSARELRRLLAVNYSPIFGYFANLVGCGGGGGDGRQGDKQVAQSRRSGLKTVRALGAAGFLWTRAEHLFDSYARVRFASDALAAWLSLQLQKIGIFIVFAVCTIVFVERWALGQWQTLDVGLVALAITYSMNVTAILASMISSFVDTEREMISVERVHEYIETTPKEHLWFQLTMPPFGWPCQGVLEFRDVIYKHSDHLEPALNGITFETRPCEKILIAGRTGAGKSSVLAAVYRLNELAAGSIFIDNVNISRIPLNILRKRLSIVSQEDVVFSGTIRSNLDPLDEYADTLLWQMIDKCRLRAIVTEMGGLDAEIDYARRQLSRGQQQLICLARVALRNTRIVFFDEATARLDHETDRDLQQILGKLFANKTFVQISHRIESHLSNCDRVMVIEAGKLIEFDTPTNLRNNPESYVSRTVRQS